MRFGAAVDRLVFGVGDEIVTKTQRGQLECPGQILVTEKELKRAQDVADSVLAAQGAVFGAHKVAASGDGYVQAKLAWFDKELGNELVAKPDYLDRQRQVGYDLKTTRDISDHAIERDIRLYGYDIQAAAYLDAMEQCLSWVGPGFYFVFVQTSRPFPVRVVELDSEQLMRGQSLWNASKMAWKAGLETGNWPDQPIEAPDVRPRYNKKQHKEWFDK